MMLTLLYSYHRVIIYGDKLLLGQFIISGLFTSATQCASDIAFLFLSDFSSSTQFLTSVVWNFPENKGSKKKAVSGFNNNTFC